MSRTKKMIITAVSILGSVTAFVSGLFLTFFVVGKKIDQAYTSKRNDNEDDEN
ncbi:MAG: hypothetical protein L0J48_02010 [Alkalibacterium sp.]|uniref:Uncharacterized protein n=1 Tax=Alkalibacterium gilvum TaxID=1130080 RepID=A0A1H6RBL7_9LACT|nr:MULTISPECIES: hypothetical protein [Alkalibacterium]MDN6194059.1 hypothetical protein [Alkalibacterium sp.]MDN6293441.1 hypothetical protein [Alkalibacterium sp.]MDN6295130.1 hypothetical protein [Alkalibacterium sp.]MDN6326781.1 hypothetical protein [Alkalibacterium sp.]MDN6385417.1 hypothetical protein [Alkalibacterium sp.]